MNVVHADESVFPDMQVVIYDGSLIIQSVPFTANTLNSSFGI